jgi:hypothetical protein
MEDFAFHIAAAKKLPSVIFGFKALDPTVLIYDLTMPECEKCVVGRLVYSVIRILSLVGHDAFPNGI